MPELHSLRAPEGHIKGAAFAEFVRWFGKRDPARLERAVPLVTARHAELDASAAGLGIIASRWYSAEAVHALLDALVGDIPVDRRQKLAFDGAAAIMDATLHGIYRMLFRLMATPERYAKHAPRLWTAYYDSGQIRVTIDEQGRAVATIDKWSSHHPFICELNWGAATAIYTMMGCRQVTTKRLSCVAEGQPECRFVSSWRPSNARDGRSATTE